MRVRITKYDPKLRSADGAFTGSDWTSVSDIGRFRGLTTEEYLKTEDNYWLTLASILSFLGVRRVEIRSVDFFDKPSNALQAESCEFCRALTLGELNACGMQTLQKLFKAALREAISFVAFTREDDHERDPNTGSSYFSAECGYDYYLYAESFIDFRWIEIPGIFVERMPNRTDEYC